MKTTKPVKINPAKIKLAKIKPMKIFRTIQKNMRHEGYIRDQCAFNETQMWIFLERVVFLVLLFAYLFYVANTLRQYMDSIFMTVTGTLIDISHLSIDYRKAKIFDLIDGIEKIINERSRYPESRLLYEKTDRLVEKISQLIHCVMVYVAPLVFVLPRAISNFFLYFSTDLGIDAFELAFPTWMPFNCGTPLGYTLAVVLQLFIVSETFHYISCMLSLAFGGYFFSCSLLTELKNETKSYNKIINNKKVSRSEMVTQLCERIRFSYLKRLLDVFVELFQTTLMVLFLGCTGAICLAMLMIQQQIIHSESNEYDAIVLFVSIFFGFCALMLVFVACEFPQRIINAYQEINVIIYQTDWHLLPIDIQRMFLIIVLYTQRSLDFNFFGSISCSREQFKKVVNKAYSCFMILRTIYK